MREERDTENSGNVLLLQTEQEMVYEYVKISRMIINL